MRKVPLVVVAIGAVLLSGCGVATTATECINLIPEIIDLSSDNDTQIDSIGKVQQYAAWEDNRVCHGIARWTGDAEGYAHILFYWYREDDGTAYIGYRRLVEPLM